MKLSRRVHRRKITLVEVESKAERERNFVQELREFYREMKARKTKEESTQL